ncbi:MAG: galactose-1-phosphate uridylyltransferase, partial [Lachnospiraceae bacterium]|nr:galactose-1-phosphate uridylyltransferase [Lachnospiraceae bacterium]
MIQQNIKKLVQYGLQTGLITEADKIYTTNRLLELFRLDELEEDDTNVTMSEEELEDVLGSMMDYAYEQGIMTENSIVYRDLF